ncbi:hypothetical protein ABG768_023972 [Culter alburnus]|uniref:C2H2-type domain-containing protein n=1 Tax=Culter alburnus TaxID=194366 RepID=A0AAW2AHR3_CULAL
MNDLWNSAAFLTDNAYISKRSIRKILINKRHYLPREESNITNTMKMSLNIQSEEDISASTSCDERKNNKTRIQEMISKNSRNESTCHLHEKSSEQSSGKERRVDEADMEAVSGSNPNSQLNHERSEVTSIKVKQEVDITTSCELAAIPRAQPEAMLAECELEGNVADGPKSSQKQVLKNQVVFATIRKRGIEGDTENRPYNRMTEHRKIHSGVRPYTCSICSKAFTKSSNLAEHLTVHSGVRPHKCSECGVAFAMASRLVRHQRIHVAVRSYRCQGCDMSFGHLAALKRHEKQHGEGMIFVCGLCSKSFPQDSLLTEHMHSHVDAKTRVP